MRRDFRSNQRAAAKQMAIGASRTTSQRQGNCSSRNSGSRFQIGRETGTSRNRIAGGMRAIGSHHLRSPGTTPRNHAIAPERKATASIATATMET